MLLLPAIVTVLHIAAGVSILPPTIDPSFAVMGLGIPITPDTPSPKPAIKDFPYAVILESNHQAFCAGALLSPFYVVTSDVCANRVRKYPNTTVRAGSSYPGKLGSERLIADVIIHEDYEKYYPHRSIGLLRVNENFIEDSSLKSIKLIEVDELVKPNTKVTVPGWGEVHSGKMPDQLRTFEVQILQGDGWCAPWNYTICASVLMTNEESVCHGDNGDPLVVDGRLVGVQSYSEQPCDASNTNLAFVNVARYSDWINSYVESSSGRSSVAITVLLTSIVVSCAKLL